MAGLQHVQRSPHIALAQLHQSIRGIGQDFDMFFLDDLVHKYPYIRLLEWAKSKTRTSRQQRRGQLVRIVGDYAKPSVGRVLLHDSPQGHLCSVCHGIGFIKDNQLVGSNVISAPSPAATTHVEDLFGRRKCLDLLAHDINATIVGGVELEDHLAHVVGAVDSTGKGKYGGSLSCSRRAVKEEMWQAICVDEFVYGREDVFVTRDVGESCGTILLDPTRARMLAKEGKKPRVYWYGVTMASCPLLRQAGWRHFVCLSQHCLTRR